MLERIKALLEPQSEANSAQARLLSLEADGVKLMALGLKTGAFGSPPVDADTPAKAAALAGLDAALQACISVQYLACCLEALKGSGVPAKAFFRQSLLSGVAARRLGVSRDLPPTFSFGLGLLHNAGTLGLAALHGGAYGMVYQAASTGEELAEAERAAFKIDHTQAGLGILIYRGFDPRICEGAAFHHGEASRVSVSARLAAAGDLLASRGDELEARSLAASLMGVPFGPVDLAASEVQRASAGLAALLGA